MIQLLDHGYIEVIESWGSDERIIEAARMSTDKGFQGWGGGEPCGECEAAGRLENINGRATFKTELDHYYAEKNCKTCQGAGFKPGDEKLLKYLWTHKHATPFEMAGLIIEVKAPIFVFREWHRHRTQSFNEMSARYIPMPDENYLPSVERLLLNENLKTKQAGVITGAAILSQDGAKEIQKNFTWLYSNAQQIYDDTLKAGVPKELARLVIPVARYSKMRASANLRNWLAFLTLRMDAGAQWEIRQYANAVGQIISEKFPRTWGLFNASR